MMRSLYSAVSGLKTHQTKMDVIGNNIANVNTEAFKASSVRFSEIMYQTTSSASSGNGAAGTGGKNAKQIGLGVTTGSTTVSITTSGSAETTGNPFDLKLTDKNSTNFFVVSDGTSTFFTRAGDFYVDGNGYLCMSSTGYTLQGWQVDANGNVIVDSVSPLQVMSPQNQTSAPESTTLAYVSGIIDKNDTNANDNAGNESVTKLIHKMCIGSNISKLLISVISNHLLINGVNKVAKNKTIISPTLLDSKNCITFKILSYIFLPSSTADTTVAKLSSVKITSAASFATSVPTNPIAHPMSAFFSAGLSFTPSPVIATTSPFFCQAVTILTLCSGDTLA